MVELLFVSLSDNSQQTTDGPGFICNIGFSQKCCMFVGLLISMSILNHGMGVVCLVSLVVRSSSLNVRKRIFSAAAKNTSI